MAAQAEGYALLLSSLLKHVYFELTNERPGRIREAIVETADRFMAAGGWPPPPLILLISTHYMLAQPGGLSIFQFTGIKCLDTKGGTVEGFHRIQDTLTQKFNEILDWSSWHKKLAELEEKQRNDDITSVERRILANMNAERPVPTLGCKTHDDWCQEGEEGERNWALFVRWFHQAKQAVILPPVGER